MEKYFEDETGTLIMDSSLSNVFRYFRILHPCLKFSAELSNRYLNLNGYREENSYDKVCFYI